MKRRRLKWTPARRAKFAATIAKKHQLKITPSMWELENQTLPHNTPNAIFVNVGGVLKRYMLRNLSVYVPEDE